MKEKYQEINVEVILFQVKDVITFSEGVVDDPFKPEGSDWY